MNGSCVACTGACPDAKVTNRPGLDTLIHPPGRHEATLATMLARLSAAEHPELRGLRTRDADDATVALLDGWACLSDVLNFYHERLLNESYLRPCIERRSAVELARLVGYEPRPGVAADAYLAFTLDDPNKEAPCEVPSGTRAFSQPGVGETMQPFETVEALTGRPRWSTLRPNLTRPQRLAPSSDRLYLAGVTTGLRPGDALLFRFPTNPDDVDPEHFRLRKVLRVETEMAEQRTLVWLQPLPVGDDEKQVEPSTAPVPTLSQDALAGLVTPPALQTGAPSSVKANPADIFSEQSFAPLDILRSVYPSLQENLSAALQGTATAALTNQVEVYAMRVKAAPRGHNAPKQMVNEPNEQPVKPDDPPPDPDHHDPDHHDPDPNQPDPNGPDQPPHPSLFLLSPSFTTTAHEWPLVPDMTAADDRKLLDLDAVYDQIAPQSWVVIERRGADALAVSPSRDGAPEIQPPVTLDRILDVASVSPTSYNLPGRVTELTLGHEWIEGKQQRADDSSTNPLELSAIRNVTVYAQSERLELAEVPDERRVSRSQIVLDGVYDGLQPGRRIIVEGERCDIDGIDGVRAAELLLVTGVAHTRVVPEADDAPPRPGTASRPLPPKDAVAATENPLRTVLTLQDGGLHYEYRRETVSIYANVARATHGESHAEVLGGGQPTRAVQAFSLRSSPLTFIADTSITGVASTLDVRVNDLRWHEAPNASAVSPDGRQYITFNDDDGTTRIVFGLGAPLPSGRDNVRAVYRSGIGHEGNVRAGQISVLASRPAGLTGVNNPLPASGGADRDDVAAIRQRAPVGLVALDRLVSEADYADVARAFGGIAKATTRVFPGQNANRRRSTPALPSVLHVTVAAVDGAQIVAGAPPISTLEQALLQQGDTQFGITVQPCVQKLVAIVGQIRLLPDYLWDAVRPVVEARLRSVFGFERRDFGQPVRADEVLATIQQVRGVDYAIVNRLGSISVSPNGLPLTPDKIATALSVTGVADVEVGNAARESGEFRPAELAYLSATVLATLLLTQIEA